MDGGEDVEAVKELAAPRPLTTPRWLVKVSEDAEEAREIRPAKPGPPPPRIMGVGGRGALPPSAVNINIKFCVFSYSYIILYIFI